MLEPVPLPESIDLASLGRLLNKVEARIHRDGWHARDSHSHLFLVYDKRDAASHQRLLNDILALDNHYIARVMCGPRIFQNVAPPWEVLLSIALGLAYDTSSAGLNMRRMMHSVRSLIGLGFIGEGWVRRLESTDELIAEYDTAVDYSTFPDKQECRALACVDAWDRGHRVVRHRDKKPLLSLDDTLASGDYMTSLRIMMDTAMGRLPSMKNFEQRYPNPVEHLHRYEKLQQADLPPEPEWVDPVQLQD